MKKCLIFIFLFPVIVFAQNSSLNKKELAKKQITELHNGVLLVRLSTYDLKIAAMQKAGKIEELKKFESGIIQMNNDLVSSFTTNFKFCPVYFFYSKNSEAVKNKNLAGLILDSNLKPIDIKLLDGKKIFIAEIGKTESDTTMRRSNEEYQFKDSIGYENRKTYYENDNISYLALLIRSEQFIQLQKPFPAYIKFKSYDQVPVKTEKINNAVINLEKELNEFYKKQKYIK